MIKQKVNLLYNQNISPDLWKELFDSNPYSSPFQSYGFFSFFNSVPGYHADAFAMESDGRLTCLSVVTAQKESGLKAYFSRRGIIYGGPLIDPDYSKDFCDLINHIQEFYKSKLIYIEVRNYFDYSFIKSIYEKEGWHYLSWLNFQLHTNDKSSIEHAMSNSRLRQIHKAMKNGAYWKEADKIEDILSFYTILTSLYRERVKKPLMKWDYFAQFFNQKEGKYLLVFFEEKVIGGIMCAILPGKAIYEFYICGLDLDYKDQYPSIMATWAAIDYANRNGIPLFDFMGAGSPDDNYGVRDFKARFGGDLVENGRFIKVLNPLLYDAGKLGMKILKKL